MVDKEKNKLLPIKKDDNINANENLNIDMKKVKINNTVPNYIYVFIIIVSSLLAAGIVLFLPGFLKDQERKAQIKSYKHEMNEGVIGEVSEESIEQDNLAFQKGIQSGNLIQGIEAKYGSRVTVDSFENIYIAGDGVIDVYDKDMNKQNSLTIKKGVIISNICCIGNELIFIATGSNSLGIDTCVVAKYNLGNNKITTLPITKNTIKSTITSLAVTNKYIFCNFMTGDAIKIYSWAGQAEIATIEVTNSLMDKSRILNVEEENIYYYEQGGVYKHNLINNKKEKLPSHIITPINLPFIYDGKVVYKKGCSIYVNKDNIITESQDIEHVNIYKNNILYNIGKNIVEYNIKTKKKRSFSSDNTVSDFYVAGNKLITSLEEKSYVELN